MGCLCLQCLCCSYSCFLQVLVSVIGGREEVKTLGPFLGPFVFAHDFTREVAGSLEDRPPELSPVVDALLLHCGVGKGG